MQEGERGDDPTFSDFRDKVKRAQGGGRAKLLREILADEEGGWKARAWVLERIAPEDFGKRERHDINANVNANVTTSWKDIAGGLGLSNGEDGDES